MKALIGFIAIFGFLLMMTVLAEAEVSSVHSIKTAALYAGSFHPAGSMRIVARIPHAPRVVRAAPACPGKDYTWIEGYWKWNSARNRYEYFPGYWARTKPGCRYVPGSWIQVKGGFVWKAGIWVKV